MPRHPRGIRSGAPVSAPYPEVLVNLDNGNKGGWYPLQFPACNNTVVTDLPTILNVVVDTVLWHWVSVVTPMEGVFKPKTEGFLQDIQWMMAYFNTNDGLLT